MTISGTALGAGAQQLTLLGRTARGRFAPIAQTVADAGGAYSFTTAPLENTSYRVIDADAASTVLFVGVRDLLTVAIEPGSSSSAEASLQAGEADVLGRARRCGRRAHDPPAARELLRLQLRDGAVHDRGRVGRLLADARLRDARHVR